MKRHGTAVSGPPGRRWAGAGLATLALSAALAGVGSADAAPPPKSTAGVPSPGKSVASGDDASAIAENPANLAFLPAAEVRWNWVWTQAASPLPIRGHSVDLAVPLWIFATGLRFDFMDPPNAAPAPFDQTSQLVRWGLSARAGQVASLGTTMSWSNSSLSALDGQFGLSSGLTLRPMPQVSASFVARDWNEPVARSGANTERSYDMGLALRPIVGLRDFELGLEAEYYEQSSEWVPRATLGIDVPRLGRLRGDVTMYDATEDPSVLAMAGLDINVGPLQASGGGVFGNAITKSGTGFYAGAAIRAYREPGVQLPAQVARIRIDSTPGVRGHTRLLRRLWAMADDPEVEGVLFLMRSEPASSLAHAEEVADAVRGLRARGKKVMCHLEDAGGRSLFVCSQADRTVMNPAGGLRFSGLSSRYLYFGGLMDKFGVRADFVRIGRHKLAAEQFTRKGTDVAKADHEELIREFEKVYLSDIGGGLRIPMSELKRRIATGPFIAPEARDAGLIHGLAYEDELGQVVEEVMGRRARIMDDDPLEEAPRMWGKVPKVAIVYLHGNMVDGESLYIPVIGIRLAGSRTVSKALKTAREDPSVKAVVFRVESGGGSSLAADVILREAQLTAKEKPLIVSMGTSAASGGYYAAVAGDTIFANRATITGSIGIFYGKVDVSGLLGKLGVGVETFRSAPRADAESFFRPFTDEEREFLGVKVKQFYDLFIGRVSEGRDMKPAEVDRLARGKVWTGRQAVENGLADRVGGLREALNEARRQGRLPVDSPVLELPVASDSILGLLLNLAGASAQGATAAMTTALIPAEMMDVARAMAPFVVYAPNQPLARVELFERTTFGAVPTFEEP